MQKLAASLALLTIVLAGCVSEPAEDQGTRSVAKRAASAPRTASAAPEPENTSIDFAGQVSTYGCVFVPAVATHCQGAWSDRDMHSFSDGLTTPIRLTGTLTWNATSLATEELNAYLVVNDRFETGFPVAWGASPLEVDFDLAHYAGQHLALGVSSTRCTCVLVGGVVTAAPQSFVFEGKFFFEAAEE